MAQQHPLVDLIEKRRKALGDKDFSRLCQLNQVKPEELESAQNGCIPDLEALGPISGLLDVSMDELVEFICKDDSSSQEDEESKQP